MRRLVFAVAALVLADRFEPALLRSLEEARYEDPARDFRFGNSDYFGLGPLVAYLREHPRGHVPRVVFLGNSIMYGYLLDAADALPARYQRLERSAKVFNAAINNFSTSSACLVAKAVIDSADLTYVLRGQRETGPRVPAMLPRLIPLDDADLAQFHLSAPNDAERILSQAVNHWRLYRDADRLQAALFGASTQQYIYVQKGTLLRALTGRVLAEQVSDAASDETVTIETPVSNAIPDAARLARLRAQSPELWQLGDLSLSRRKRVVFLQLPGESEDLEDVAIADFNRVFSPYARVVVVHIPRRLTFDGVHLTSTGADRVARALWHARPEDDRR